MTVEDSVARRAPLVGRETELGVIERAVAAAGSGRPTWLSIGGEPGIGKTRLLDQLCRRADERGHLVLAGRGIELERAVPFAALVDVLDDYLGSLDPRCLAPCGPETLGELRAVFPSLGAAHDGAPAPPPAPAERYRTHRAIRALAARLAASGPLVLAVDDLHWADAASVELVAYLLRRPVPGVLVAVAARSHAVPEAVAGAIAAAERDAEAGAGPAGAVVGRHLELRPLTRAATDALLGDQGADARRRDEVYRAAGGNPFYVLQLARSHAPSPPVPLLTATDDVPPAVLAATAAEVGERSAVAQDVARAAAVVGEPFTPELVAATAGVDDDVVLAAVDELIAADLVRATVVPRRFVFRHPIVRHAVYASASAGWLLAAHARAADALAAAGAGALERAPHVERAAGGRDAGASALLAEAGERSLGRAPAEAAHWFSAALRLLPPGSDPSRRLVLTATRGRALAAAGRLAEARGAFDQALEMLPVDDTVLRGKLLAACAGLDNLLGHHGQARSRLVDALDTLGDPHSAPAVAIRISLAADCFYTGEFDEMRRWEHAARQDAAALGDQTVLAVATGLVAGADYMTGDVAAARGATAEACGLLERLDDIGLTEHLTALTWFGWTEGHLGHLADSLAHLDRFAGVARLTGQEHLLPLIDVGRVYALLWSGRVREASEVADRAVDAALFSGNGLFRAAAAAARTWSALLAGDVADAVRTGEEAVVVAGPEPDVVAVTTRFFLAEARLEAGEPARCRDGLVLAAGGEGLPLIERPLRPRWFEVLTRAELARGDIDAAGRWACRAEETASGPARIAVRSSEARRASAAVALAAGDHARAALAAAEAAELADADGARIEAARARIVAGRACALAGRRTEAVEMLEPAESALADCGARRLRDEAARELRRLGRRVPRGGRCPGSNGSAAGLDALSRREREVAELVADGRSNRQIAAALFVSAKTVETHLAKVFTKLGVSSRAAVAAAIGRDGR